MTLINGTTADTVSAADRGLHYGDGVFETVAIVNGEPQHWHRHLQRLKAGALRLGIPAPDASDWWNDWTLLSRSAASKSVLKLMLTRGAGGRGYAPPMPTEPTRIVSFSEWPVWPERNSAEGIVVSLSSVRLGRNPALAGIKHLNRLEQVLASAEVATTGAADGLMLDVDGNLIESTRANLFLVIDGQLLTPSLDACGIEGIMRGVILEVAKNLGISTSVQSLKLDLLNLADEAFLCNSLIGIWPISRCINTLREFRVGELTRKLQLSLRELNLLP